MPDLEGSLDATVELLGPSSHRRVAMRELYRFNGMDHLQIDKGELPLAVALPRSEADVRELVAFAHQNRIGLIPRGAGTSLAGQVVGGGLVVQRLEPGAVHEGATPGQGVQEDVLGHAEVRQQRVRLEHHRRAALLGRQREQVDLAEFPHVRRWYETMMARPGVKRGFAIDLR